MRLEVDSLRAGRRACVHKGAQPNEHILHVVGAQRGNACVCVCGHVEGALGEVSSEEGEVPDCSERGASVVCAQHGSERSADLISIGHCTLQHCVR